MYVNKHIANITVNNEIIANPVFFCFAVTQQQHQRRGDHIKKWKGTSSRTSQET